MAYKPIEIVKTLFNISPDDTSINLNVTFRINDMSMTVEDFKVFLEFFKKDLENNLIKDFESKVLNGTDKK